MELTHPPPFKTFITFIQFMSAKPLYVPLLDNGNGDIKAAFMIDFWEAFKGREVIFSRASDSHANRGMNKVACAFLKTDCDWWINIDADILFTRKHVDYLLSHGDAKLVYGIYPKKSDDTEPCLCTFPEVQKPGDDNLVTVRRSGRGFMLVHRSLLEAMKEDNGGPALRYHNHGEVQWDFFPSGPVTGELSAMPNAKDPDGYPLREWISEDWYFCERARALGVPTAVDARIALGHEGSKQYRFKLEQVTRLDSNITSWRDIHGWFDFQDLYKALAERIPNGGTFAEVGSWLGRSLGAFSEYAKQAGKKINLHAIDTFVGEPGNEVHEAVLKAHGGSVEKAFRANMKALGLNGELTVHPADSALAAARFDDGSLDAVFIDADHSEEAVARDIAAWLPKVKRGGVIAGHDVDELGVAKAVANLLPTATVVGRCWVQEVV